MADSSPDRRQRPTSSSPSETQSSPQSSPSPHSPSRAWGPPSEPRPSSRASFSQLDLSADRPARLQIIVALILVLVLVAIPLYLWRRPRAESIVVSSSTEPSAEPTQLGSPPATTALAEDAKPTLGQAKTLSCHDPGTKRTAPERCDRVVEVEKALAKAIGESASCVPKDAGGGTVQYVADVSFARRSVTVSTPKDGRSIKNPKVVSACQSAVKGHLQTLSLESLQHAHARYKIAITATYAGPAK